MPPIVGIDRADRSLPGGGVEEPGGRSSVPGGASSALREVIEDGGAFVLSSAIDGGGLEKSGIIGDGFGGAIEVTEIEVDVTADPVNLT